MKRKTLREEADAAEAQRALAARQHANTPPVTDVDMAVVLDTGEVDEYVAVTGEYPISGDLADGELAEDSFVDELVGPDPALGETKGGLTPVPQPRTVPPR